MVCSARLHPIVGEKPAGFPRQLASLPELEPVKKRLASEPSETNLRKPLPSSGNKDKIQPTNYKDCFRKKPPTEWRASFIVHLHRPPPAPAPRANHRPDQQSGPEMKAVCHLHLNCEILGGLTDSGDS